MSTLSKKIITILIIFFVSVLIALPTRLPVNINFAGLNINQELVKNPLNISIGNINISRDFELKFGLDLVGGSYFVYEAKTENLGSDATERAMESLIEVVSRRINLFGVAESNVQRASFEGRERIVVELPGVTDTERAKGLVGATAQLVFSTVDEEAESVIPTDLTGADIASAQVIFSQLDGKPAVGIEFTAEGAQKFEQITGDNVGKAIPILLDGQLVSAPVVQEKIIGTSAQISGDFSVTEARELAIQINAGALPVEIELIEERTIGPTLGQEAIEKSVKAGLIGVAAVALIMILVYGKLGIVSVLSLIFFAVLTMAIYKMVPVVLTLPGIAGFLLTVGMSVDANILVFERFREERSRGSSPLFAMESAFKMSWSSIRDANVATLTTAFVLANPFNWSLLHTSGSVRGFAITLSLGVLINLFTAVFVSRNILRVVVERMKNV